MHCVRSHALQHPFVVCCWPILFISVSFPHLLILLLFCGTIQRNIPLNTHTHTHSNSSFHRIFFSSKDYIKITWCHFHPILSMSQWFMLNYFSINIWNLKQPNKCNTNVGTSPTKAGITNFLLSFLGRYVNDDWNMSSSVNKEEGKNLFVTCVNKYIFWR